MGRPYDRKAWAIVKAQVLERDQHLCQIRTPICTRVAVTADHIKRWQHGGAWFDPDNLRAACAECNSAIANPKSGSGYSASRVW